jgi:anti-sigma B factor antagonist
LVSSDRRRPHPWGVTTVGSLALMGAGEGLSIRVTEDDGMFTIALGGYLDIATAPRFREKLLDLFVRGVRLVVIDLGDLDYLDSVGLGILVGGLKRYREVAGDLHLRRPRGQVDRVLQITGVAALFKVETA